MVQSILSFAPGSCARVPLIALEEAGADFSLQTIAFMAGEHKSPEFRQRNPKGKVPALHIDGLDLTENVAILDYLANRFPEARLLPEADTALARAERLADLAFCAATLHPLVTRIRMSPLFAGLAAARAVWQKGCEAMDEYFALIDRRLADGAWWYGEHWSVIDAYLNWIFFRVDGARYDVARFENFVRHDEAMRLRPAFQRALARERDSQLELESRGLLFIPPDPADFA